MVALVNYHFLYVYVYNIHVLLHHREFCCANFFWPYWLITTFWVCTYTIYYTPPGVLLRTFFLAALVNFNFLGMYVYSIYVLLHHREFFLHTFFLAALVNCHLLPNQITSELAPASAQRHCSAMQYFAITPHICHFLHATTFFCL